MRKFTKEEKEEQVYRILLLPIHCCEKGSNISNTGKNICTGQKYCRKKDADMSDFAIGFYEIFYKKILGGTILNANGKFRDNEFAGDTMNSFNSIANVTKGAGKSKHRRTKCTEWPLFLQEYYEQYHCLANFWMIPMKIGRTSKKFNYYDSLDVCLGILKEDYNSKMGIFNGYIRHINNFESFCEIHCIPEFQDKREILNLYKKKPIDCAEKLVNFAMNNIKERASQIAKSEYSNDLWNYFNELKIFEVTVCLEEK